jgi:hypothetical protein
MEAEMKKIIKGLLGIIASLPGACVAFVLIGWFCTFAFNFILQDEGPPVGFFIHHGRVIWKLFFMALWLAAGLLLASMTHIALTSRLEAQEKGIWLLILAMGNIIVLPLNWYFNIWRETVVPLLTPARNSRGRERTITEQNPL